MKFVFLPGLDGTGDLFSEYLREKIGEEGCFFPLPLSGSQSYDDIASIIIEKLPQGDLVLIGESFSGPLASTILRRIESRIKGIVFVASFLSTPSPWLIRLAKYLPLKFFLNMSLVQFVAERALFDRNANPVLFATFLSAVEKVPEAIIKKRLNTIQSFEMGEVSYNIPVLYLQAKRDDLVAAEKADEFSRFFKQLEIEEIDSTHFLIQTRTDEFLEALSRFRVKLK